MILGANTLQVPLIEKANSRGYMTIVVSPNTSEIGHKLATESVKINVRDEDKILRIAQKLNIDGIITDQTDIAVRSVAYVAEKMGLPGIGYETACLFTDKHLMRERCKQLGIKTLQYQLVKSLAEALDFLDILGGKAILKPVDNQGSKGVSLIDSKEKMKEKFLEAMDYSKQKEVLIEEIAHGREFVSEGLMLNNRFSNLICGDTYYFSIPDTFSATRRIFPTEANDQLRDRVENLNEKIIRGFGLRQGISHSEFIMNGDDIILIETAARGGGVFISSDLISLSTGLRTEDFLLNIALGEQNDYPDFERDKCACCYLAFYLPIGEVIKIKGIKEVQNLSFTYRNNLDSIEMGMKIISNTDKTSRFFVIISATDKQELSAHINTVQSLLNEIVVKQGDGEYKTPIWN